MDYFFQYIFNGLATLLAGSLALLVYLYSKRDRKIEATNIILNEIYTAEREIKNIKNNKIITDYSFILPSNHWDQYQHLFVKNFDPDEINKISDFFKACSLAEESIKLIKSYLIIAMDQKSRNIQDKILNLMGDNDYKTNYELKRDEILKVFHNENYFFMPNAPKEKLFDYLKNINELSVSPVGTKLKNIRNSKWYRIIV